MGLGEPRDSEGGEKRVEAVEAEGRLELVVDGVVQSVAVGGADVGRGYWPAMLPEERPRSALVLGLGGGTIPHLLSLRFGPLPIVGVDDDPAVVGLARARFGLDHLPCLRVLVQDAYSFVAECQDVFDFIAVDLFRAGEIPRGVTSTTFLRHVKRLLSPQGLASFNLARDRRAATRIHRLDKVLYVEKRILVGFNVVVHCRRSYPRADG